MRLTSLAILLLILVGMAFSYAQMTTVGIGKSGSGVAPTCDGTIDLSTGCAMPMLGGA